MKGEFITTSQTNEDKEDQDKQTQKWTALKTQGQDHPQLSDQDCAFSLVASLFLGCLAGNMGCIKPRIYDISSHRIIHLDKQINIRVIIQTNIYLNDGIA